MSEKRSLAVVVAADMTIKAFLTGHLRAWSQRCTLNVFANSVDAALLERLGVSGRLRPVSIARPIAPLADFRALLRLWQAFRAERFEAVFSVTPKAGLLAMLAGFAARVPVRIHVFTGQVWATRSGLARWLLKTLDRLTASLATHVLTDSESQRQFMIAEGVVSAARSTVLAKGSISGVDLARFRPDPAVRKVLRSALGIVEDQRVLLFLGRLNPDKGVLDLAEAFARLAPQHLDAQLLFVGPDEAGMRQRIESCCAEVSARVHFVDFTDVPEQYMAAADVFCLPSYREGFGSVVIEAAATGVPTVASRIYGLTDAVLDGETGLLHEAHDIQELTACLTRLLEDRALRARLGRAARARALCDFPAEQVSAAFARYVFERLEELR